MSMVSRALGTFLVLIMIASCAQVGTISGGPVDETAPKIKSMTPENQSTNVSTQEIILEFEDFIKLNNPAQTIQVIPPDFNVNASNKGKTVTLNWTEPMQANTTYSIFLNKTIQDITESNDSIMQLVFSTGDFIDSLTYTCFVKDAFTQKPAKKVMVGLFSDEDTLKPNYFSQTNEFGEAKFNYVKKGNYFIRSFKDVDNNLKISKNEPVGFKQESIKLDASVIDSIPISLFQPKTEAKITTFLFQGPGTFILGANRSIADATFKMNNILVPEENITRFSVDSLLLCYNPEEVKSIELITQSANINDTNTLRISSAKSKSFQIQAPTGNKINFSEPFSFRCSDAITQIDTSKIKIVNQNDSTRIQNYQYSIRGNIVSFKFDKSKITNVLFEFDTDAFTGATQTSNVKTNFPISILKERELGSIILDLSEFSKPLLLEVYIGALKVKSIEVTNNEAIKLKNLEIGEYTFKIIDDKNANGLWDTGDFQAKILPESIYFFKESTKVRANWEINVQLAPNN